MKLEEILAFITGKATDEDKQEILDSLAAVPNEVHNEIVEGFQTKLATAKQLVEAKEGLVASAKAKVTELEEKTDIDAIKAQVRQELEQEASDIAALSSEIKDLGFEVSGDSYIEIMANAIDASGAKSENAEGERFSDEVLAQVWGTVKAMSSKRVNDEQKRDLAGNESAKSKLNGSRSARVNKK